MFTWAARSVLAWGCLGAVVLDIAAAAEPLPAQALLRRGDQAADRGRYDQALKHYQRAYEILVPRLRKLPFRRPVQARLMNRRQVREYMEKEFREEFTPEELYFFDRSLKALGAAPRKLDLVELTKQLLSEEIGGFYSSRNGMLVLVTEGDRPGKESQRGLLARLFANDEPFDKQEAKTTLAHELTHALQDQHFDLKGWHDRTPDDDDDMHLAFSALVEGDATLLMMQEAARQSGESTQEVLTMPPYRADLAFGLMIPLMGLFSGPAYQKAPPLMRQGLLFPYHKGLVFVLHQTRRGGWKAVNECFADPPLSTEQVLHPEKYRGPRRDEPVRIVLPKTIAGVPKGWRELGRNVLGEFQLMVLLGRTPAAYRAAAGWDGDRYVVWEHADGRLGLVLATHWDTVADAQEFFLAWEHYVRHKLHPQPRPWQRLRLPERIVAEELPQVQEVPLRHGDWFCLLRRRGSNVVCVCGFDPPTAARLAQMCHRAKVEPKRWPEKKPPGGKSAASEDDPAAE